MATTIPVMQTSQPAASQLCDYCHQKPKFSNHLYCSKTCAGQAATLCNHCHKKPKYQNFEFCGKNCAALANPGGKPNRNAAQGGPAPASQATGGSKPSFQSKGAQKAGGGAGGAPATFDPVQLAKLVAQHIPQVQAYMAPIGAAAAAVSQNQQGPLGGGVYAPQVMAPAAQPQTQVPAPVVNPFLDPTGAPGAANGTGAGIPNNFSHTPPGTQPLHISTKQYTGNQQASDNLECLIPGCGQPVHIDAKGLKTSEYCSMRHREEAVLSGLRPPCIMCLTLPQSETDYFCSRACREESMNKQQEYEVVSDPE
ncbi:hypothetical protein BJ165DRAFT_1416911 [Panaeolus papilionaceus]|nr:hypothetical protein BJ165DRAFT_1416911 [Panaeolus papilionaceus]